MFVHDDRLVRRHHQRRIDDLRRESESRRVQRHHSLPSGRRSLRRVVGRSMVSLGSRLAADPSATPTGAR
ncbi:MAG TPA: hypothetical protein VIF84_03655 [Candidatus Limnocylindrales bacterium]|jgi:hypothetical protein